MAKDESGNYKVDEVKKADASVKTMADFTSPDILYKELIDSVKKYHPSTDISMIEKAYHIADEAHKGQLRKSGEPYIIHPLCVAIIEQAFFVKDNLAKLSSQSIDFVYKYYNYTSVASTYVKLYEKLLASSN